MAEDLIVAKLNNAIKIQIQIALLSKSRWAAIIKIKPPQQHPVLTTSRVAEGPLTTDRHSLRWNWIMKCESGKMVIVWLCHIRSCVCQKSCQSMGKGPPGWCVLGVVTMLITSPIYLVYGDWSSQIHVWWQAKAKHLTVGWLYKYHVTVTSITATLQTRDSVQERFYSDKKQFKLIEWEQSTDFNSVRLPLVCGRVDQEFLFCVYLS